MIAKLLNSRKGVCYANVKKTVGHINNIRNLGNAIWCKSEEGRSRSSENWT